jgi:hypothetical protein
MFFIKIKSTFFIFFDYKTQSLPFLIKKKHFYFVYEFLFWTIIGQIIKFFK